ncbi:conserved hypothetical protein [Dehalogenimonas lykanthroporepellens BL-DC-9]|nr:conserved hypothetical protein [Dehalogenimonas lykanthroporepellens BL-DC-9]
MPTTNEIPSVLLKANQAGIILFVALAAVTGSPVFIGLVLAVELGGLIWGIRGNLFIRAARPFLTKRLAASRTESRELARFNNTLAVLFLGLASGFFLAGLPLAGYIVAGVLAVVVTAALAGYCLGCVLYYRFKMLKSRLGLRFSTR